MVKVYAIDGVTPVVHPTAFVHPTAVLIGDVIIGPGCYVGPCASVRADFGRFVMGPNSNFQDNCTAHTFSGGEVLIGENCNIGHGAVLHGATLHNRILIGMNAVIMDGVEIQDDVLVAALAFVPAAMEIPPGVIVAGGPAKILRKINKQEKQWISDGNIDYQELNKRSKHSLEETEALTKIDHEAPRLTYEGSKPLYVTRTDA
ncbi:MAG: phenylacetic acid degradation protein PaaY [Pseudomonadota bacterium]|nr:phenylacetic acid degradation protein PaaY [Pseudomonadota bacterium]